jgi:hypothetical protein
MRSRYSKEMYMLLAYDAFRGFYEVEVEHLMKKLKVPNPTSSSKISKSHILGLLSNTK